MILKNNTNVILSPKGLRIYFLATRSFASLRMTVLALCLLFLLNSASYAVPPKMNPLPSDYHTGISWQEAQKSDKPIIVNFYVDWCHYCKKFAPVFDKLRKEYKDKFSFVIIKSDDPKNASLAREFNIYSYPSVYLVDKNSDKKIFLNQQNYHNLEKMQEELNNYIEQQKSGN